MKYFFFIFNIIYSILFVSSANCSENQLSLREFQKQAIASSNNIKAINAELLSVKNKADSQDSLQLPRITLDASYKYISEVPKLKLPGGVISTFGDNQNYSIGPMINWTLFDFGSLKNSINGFKEQVKSKEAEQKLINRQIILNARLAYFKVQLRLEQQRLINDSYKLVESQFKDIKMRVSVGASSRIDLLSAHKDLLNLKLQSRQIQSDIESDFRDLSALVEKDNAESITTVTQVDTIASSINELNKFGTDITDEQALTQSHVIQIYTANAESFYLASKSFKANLLPKISLYAKTSLDYPNGPVLENFNQNIIGVNFSMPIFEGNRSKNDAAEKNNMAVMSEHRKNQAQRELIRDLRKSQNQLSGLREKIEIYKNLVNESEERSKLIYGSYKVGRSSFLEVQSANLQALEAKVLSTTNDIQILNQLAYLASISGDQ